ncbi:uncharacterized protein LOC128233830 [Mya arenaria]|uniref:uncharacterized protein LOC128233830 n=1 Tax=Mya arenaria TaxID=6604 RepID=UPI0022E1677F|nr:uncharacterized protein LOC128233830 [Mya arenaria]XP_052803648.1 uncharacterized protein LOC128233830 [Mya arenaria]
MDEVCNEIKVESEDGESFFITLNTDEIKIEPNQGRSEFVLEEDNVLMLDPSSGLTIKANGPQNFCDEYATDIKFEVETEKRQVEVEQNVNKPSGHSLDRSQSMDIESGDEDEEDAGALGNVLQFANQHCSGVAEMTDDDLNKMSAEELQDLMADVDYQMSMIDSVSKSFETMIQSCENDEKELTILHTTTSCKLQVDGDAQQFPEKTAGISTGKAASNVDLSNQNKTPCFCFVCGVNRYKSNEHLCPLCFTKEKYDIMDYRLISEFYSSYGFESGQSYFNSTVSPPSGQHDILELFLYVFMKFCNQKNLKKIHCCFCGDDLTNISEIVTHIVKFHANLTSHLCSPEIFKPTNPAHLCVLCSSMYSMKIEIICHYRYEHHVTDKKQITLFSDIANKYELTERSYKCLPCTTEGKITLSKSKELHTFHLRKAHLQIERTTRVLNGRQKSVPQMVSQNNVPYINQTPSTAGTSYSSIVPPNAGCLPGITGKPRNNGCKTKLVCEICYLRFEKLKDLQKHIHVAHSRLILF